MQTLPPLDATPELAERFWRYVRRNKGRDDPFRGTSKALRLPPLHARGRGVGGEGEVLDTETGRESQPPQSWPAFRRLQELSYRGSESCCQRMQELRRPRPSFTALPQRDAPAACQTKDAS